MNEDKRSKNKENNKQKRKKDKKENKTKNYTEQTNMRWRKEIINGWVTKDFSIRRKVDKKK